MKKKLFIVFGLMFAISLAGCSSETVTGQAEETTEDYTESYESLVTQNEEEVVADMAHEIFTSMTVYLANAYINNEKIPANVSYDDVKNSLQNYLSFDINDENLTVEWDVNAENYFITSVTVTYNGITKTHYAEAANETTTETTEAAAESLWEKRFYIDEFDRPTDEFYIFAAFDGYFSNSATTKSSLTAAFYINRYSYNNEISDSVGIALFEYGSSRVKNYYSKGKHYDIQILEENDNVIKERGWLGSEDNTIYVWGDENANTIIEAMKNNKKLTFRIDEEDGMDTYLFDVDCTGFAELFDSTDWGV